MGPAHAPETRPGLPSAFSRIVPDGMRRTTLSLSTTLLLAACASTPPAPREPRQATPPPARAEAGTLTAARANLAAASATLASGRIDLRALGL